MLWLAVHSRIICHRQFSEDCFFPPNSVSPMYLYLNKSKDDAGSVFCLFQHRADDIMSRCLLCNVQWTAQQECLINTWMKIPPIHMGRISIVSSYPWATVTLHCGECSQAVCTGMTAFAVKDISYLIWGELKAFRADACVSCSAHHLLRELPELLVF